MEKEDFEIFTYNTEANRLIKWDTDNEKYNEGLRLRDMLISIKTIEDYYTVIDEINESCFDLVFTTSKMYYFNVADVDSYAIKDENKIEFVAPYSGKVKMCIKNVWKSTCLKESSCPKAMKKKIYKVLGFK